MAFDHHENDAGLDGHFHSARMSSHFRFRLKVYPYQTSASKLLQLCDDASDTGLTENNGVAPEWGCNPFSSDTIVLNDIASIIAEFSQH